MATNDSQITVQTPSNPIHWIEDVSCPSDHAALPITVVIPVRNEIESIDALLQAVFSQSPPPAAVVAIDAGSTDGTREVLRRWKTDHSSLSLIEVEKAYPGEGRNLGTEQASTPWVAYLDAGTLPDPDWLPQLWRVASATDASVVYGYFRPLLTTRVARWFALAVLPGARPKDDGWMRIHSITCSLVKVEAWRNVGGFPPFRAAEDRIFMAALSHIGHVAEAPSAAITWHSPQSWLGVWQRTCGLAEHSARAGRSGDWHWPTLRLWGLGLLVLILFSWPIGPGFLMAASILRALRRIRRHKLDPDLQGTQWRDVAGTAVMLLVVDLAMFSGWLRRLLRP